MCSISPPSVNACHDVLNLSCTYALMFRYVVYCIYVPQCTYGWGHDIEVVAAGLVFRLSELHIGERHTRRY
jgi:hypothetical protein